VTAVAASGVGHYAMVPKWVLHSSASDRAIRLLAVLGLYANRTSWEAWPSRRTLARELDASLSSVDRALRELVTLGVVEVVHRRNAEGEPTSNLYRLKYGTPGGASPAALPLVTDAARSIHPCSGVASPVTHRTRSIELEVLTVAFDERFWPAYPRKIKRADARKAFLKLRPNEPLIALILAAIALQARGWNEPKYIPNAATWINGRRWEDEPEHGALVVGAPPPALEYADIAADFRRQGPG